MLIGCAALVKVSALAFLPMVGLALATVALRRRELARAVACGLAAVAGAFTVVGWWIARNFWLYGEWSGMDTMYRIWGTRRSADLDVAGILALFPRVWDTYWGVFGWGNVPMGRWTYQGLLLVVLAAMLGIARHLVSRLRARHATSGTAGSTDALRQPRSFPFVFLIVWQVVMTASLAMYIRTAMYAEFGRFLFPAVSSSAILLAWGLEELLPPITKRLLPWIATSGMTGLSVVALFVYLIPAYHLSTSPKPSAITTTNSAPVANFADFAEIASYDIKTAVAAPGKAIDLTIDWHPIRETEQEYLVFVHLLSAGDNRLVAQTDLIPGGGRYPTSDWAPGGDFQETYHVPLPASVEAPMLLNVEMGLLRMDTSQRLPLVAGTKGIEGDAIRLGTVKVRAPNSAPDANVMARFEEGISLSDAHVEPKPLGDASNRQLAVQLVWRSEEFAGQRENCTVFVQLLDAAGKVVAQHDGLPANKNYPTSAWGADEVIVDTHVLQLPPSLAPGKYTILTGLYRLETGRRLGIVSSSVPQSDSAVRLDWTFSE